MYREYRGYRRPTPQVVAGAARGRRAPEPRSEPRAGSPLGGGRGRAGGTRECGENGVNWECGVNGENGVY